MKRKKSNKYPVCALQAAVREVKKGKCQSKVSRSIGIPKSTLHDHSRGKLEGVIKKPGIDPSLNEAEKQGLINYMKYMASHGLPITLSLMKIFARAIVKRSGRPTRINLVHGPSKKWCCKFFARKPQLKKRRPDRADSGRMILSAEAVADYF
ncbi:hypothetical protein DPMN_126358 [Dreissena polymorpha]|uniref:HTH psq-type domain-containing protein n=1 Tax=Dreissena polymorpha TaxID=45954 RepID=A0A9D4GVJ7_DREPO|nr:hypothetical protein DPMN_126358 [Dreissena polymorpha]